MDRFRDFLRQGREVARIFTSGCADSWHFLRHSAVAPWHARRYRDAHMVMDAHRVEKSMSLPHPNPARGLDAVHRLEDGLRVSKGQEPFVGDFARTALRAREEWVKGGRPTTVEGVSLAAGVRPLASSVGKPSLPETDDASRFFRTRRSVRNFEKNTMDPGILRAALEDALYAPSVCNRQPTHVFLATNQDTMDRWLRHQNGNRGFGHTADAVAIVTTDPHHFVTSGERRQGSFDAGLFTMQFMLALHARGLASCPLNLALPYSKERRLAREARIPAHHRLCTMLAIGRAHPSAVVAASPRRAFEARVHFVDGTTESDVK